MKCQYFEVDCELPGGPWESCLSEATLTCCDYGGHVCDAHRCRCSRPLEFSGDNPCIELGTE